MCSFTVIVLKCLSKFLSEDFLQSEADRVINKIVDEILSEAASVVASESD
jgi:hypothetical protein